MRTVELLARVRRSIGETGLWQTLQWVCTRIYRRAFPAKIPTHPFDLAFSVDTSGLIGGKLLASGHVHDRHITAYWGTAPSLLTGALNQWETSLAETSASLRDYTFLDIGCGKGRVLMLASSRPFHRIIGVELNPALVSITETNLRRWEERPHACESITVLNADALDFALPESPVLIYLFNPFDPPVLQRLLERIQTLSLTREDPVDFIYARAEHANLFDAIPNMQQLWEGDVSLTAEEKAADAFQTQSLDYRIYRLTPRRRA